MHPLHVATFVVVTLAAIFAFVAMQVAFEARDAAHAADHGWGGDNSYEINELQSALIRAGVIGDPWDFGDDHHELDGPWARCLTADEVAAMGLGPDDVELPPACETVEVALVEECSDPPPDYETEPEGVEHPEPCELWHRIDGLRYDAEGPVHLEDVEASAEHWYLVDGTDGVDRLARGQGDTFLHVIGEGWVRVHRW